MEIDLEKINYKNKAIKNKIKEDYEISNISEDEVFSVYSPGLVDIVFEENAKRKYYLNVELNTETFEVLRRDSSKYIEKNYSVIDNYLIPTPVVELINENNKINLIDWLKDNIVVVPLVQRFSTKNEIYTKTIQNIKLILENKDPNLKISGYDVVIRIKDNNYVISNETKILSEISFEKYGQHGDSLIDFYFYKNQNLYSSKELENRLFEFLNNNENIKKIVFKDVPNPEAIYSYKYVEDFINKCFVERGYKGFKVTVQERVRYHYSWEEQIYGGRYVPKECTENSYSMSVSYNGKEILGKGNGWVIVRITNDEPFMVHSAWCQRANRWGKESGYVDQKYNSWNFIDWITSPYAEKIGLNIEEFPILYKGNLEFTKNARAELLKKLAHIPLD